MLISGKDVAALVGLIGEEAHAFGVRHAAHAVASDVIADPAQLAEAIRQDGDACLGAWLEAASPPVRQGFLLRLPPGSPVEEGPFGTAHRQAAPMLMSRVQAHLSERKQAHAS